MEARTVKLLDAGVTVEGVGMNGRTQVPVVLRNCPDSPTKKMLKSFDELGSIVPGMLGWDRWADAVSVYGITYSPKGAGGTVVFHIKLTTLQGSTATNTDPFHIRVEDEAGVGVLPDTAFKVVKKLLREAEAYHEGPREQGDFFESEEEQPAASVSAT